MLTEYTKESFIPLALFNLYDSLEFKTYSDISKSNNLNLGEADIYISSCLEQYKNQHLLIQLLLLFPNIAFSNIGEFDLDEQLDVKSVHNKEKLKQALNFRFNVKVFKTQFSLIDELDGANINYEGFFSELFIYSYKYFFVQLSDSLISSTEIDENGIQLDYNISISSFIEKYKKKHNQLDNNNLDLLRKIQKSKLNKQIKYSFSFNSDFHKQIIKELNIYTKNSWLARHLYSIIDSNISLPENINNRKRNELLRPLYREVVCKICYKEVFGQDYSSQDLNTKYRKFLTTYKKNKT
jgi:hypothetical protein|tara:strand:- start:4058 stop:4945 length:888 start_codon:yes stop_codon:yes gene_type:complete